MGACPLSRRIIRSGKNFNKVTPMGLFPTPNVTHTSAPGPCSGDLEMSKRGYGGRATETEAKVRMSERLPHK